MLLRRLLVLPLIIGCASSDSSDSEQTDWEGDGRSDDPSAAGLAVTSQRGLTMYQGYNRLLDLGLPQCVEPTVDKIKPGDVDERFDVTLIGSREQLADKLGVDLGIKFKFLVVDANAGVNFLKTYNQTTSSVAVLFRLRQSYGLTSEAPVNLTATALSLLETNPAGFLAKCGNMYLKGVNYRAETNMLVQFNAVDEATAQNLKANLGLTVNIPAAPSGMLNVALENAAKTNGVSVSISVGSEGFLLNNQPATGALVSTFLGGALTAATFEKLDQLRNAMAQSILDDMCRDGGGTNCGGGPSTSGTRFARLSRVLLAPYITANNSPVPSSTWDGYEEIATFLENADKYLRTLSKLQNDMEAAYLDEIQPFLTASASGNVNFGIRAPAAPIFTMSGLTAIAKDFAARFRPDDGVTIGTINAPLNEKLRKCWNGATQGSLNNCRPASGTVNDMAEVKLAAEALDQYKTTGRISPVRYKTTTPRFASDAAANCAALKDPQGKQMRLATAQEAERLALPIAVASFQRSTVEPQMVWVVNSAQTCTLTTQRMTLKVTASGDHSLFCKDTNTAIPAMCVPGTGPFPVE
jgi:hypothetical protein